jgi:ketosteroid isomerase-like protein
MTVEEWVEAYGRAWREQDADAVVGLFTADAEYRSSPFREPHLGSEEIRAYWESATATQEEADVRMGDPLVAGNVAAVEWWTTMRDGGEELTLPGCLLLRFAPDGRCEALREYWSLEPGRREPHPGWGAWHRP